MAQKVRKVCFLLPHCRGSGIIADVVIVTRTKAMTGCMFVMSNENAEVSPLRDRLMVIVVVVVFINFIITIMISIIFIVTKTNTMTGCMFVVSGENAELVLYVTSWWTFIIIITITTTTIIIVARPTL